MPIDDMTLARVLHVAAIVGWIGGVWFVTFAVMPAIARSQAPEHRLKALYLIEQRFSAQAKFWILLAGLSGLWMTWRANLWWRLADPAYWWMHAMIVLWLVFFVMLFIAEPLFLHRRAAGSKAPERDFRVMVNMHLALSLIALVTVLGGMAGAHGLI